MSGMCALLARDQVRIDPELLLNMTMSMSFRGPDAQRVWSDAHAGLGHALLKVGDRGLDAGQPLTDGNAWITADARIDARAELIAKLSAAGFDGADSCDAALILRAYRCWGRNCVDHLTGDFSFAIWDQSQQSLFCARDRFGVKPFFYAADGSVFGFSNTLKCLRMMPGVSDRLDDVWVADFLIFERSHDPSATAFIGIKRLPPAHVLVCSQKGIEIAQYWALPSGAEVAYRSKNDYVDQFRCLLETAISDRTRCLTLGLEMSGGLDSSAIASISALRGSSSPSRPELHAFTVVYDRLIADRERQFAKLVADKAGFPITFRAGDEYRLFQECQDSRLPEPRHDPAAALTADAFRDVAQFCRVGLTGWDGDALMSESPMPYLRLLRARGSNFGWMGGLLAYASSNPARVLSAAKRRLINQSAGSAATGYPAWLNPEFEVEFRLRERWEHFAAEASEGHVLRPYAHRSYRFISQVSNFFEYHDAGLTGLPLEYRHPLMDTRLIEFCLSVPPWPWCVDKRLLRDAMRGVLPEPVRTRPKTPLAGSPWIERLKLGDGFAVDRFVATTTLNRYVDRNRIPKLLDERNYGNSWADMRPHSFNDWLRGWDAERRTTRSNK